MRITTTILLLFILTKSYCQVTLGIGLVKVSPVDTVINFYKKPTDKVHYKSLEFFFDVELDGWNIEKSENGQDWLNPEVFWITNFQLYFRCKAKTPEWFELMVDNKDGAALWIKQSPVTRFVTWEEYLMEMFSVKRLDNKMQKIRLLPDDASDEIKYEGVDCFRVKQLKGDWIEIFNPDTCVDKYVKTRIKTGWIKWRKGDELLIEYYKAS